jgi:hypothetical protein
MPLSRTCGLLWLTPQSFFLECTRLQRGSEDFIRHADKLAIAIQECVEDYLKDAKL